MYNVSNAFHKAVKDGAEQKALLIFKDCVFTDADISVEEGIEFRDHFNMSEDLSIGEANSNEISFSLFNDDRLLNSYKFGDFLATLGVKVGEDTYTQADGVMVTTNNASYVGYSSYPYIKRNGTALSVQPSFAVKSLLGYDDKLWAFSDNGKFAVYNDKTGENITSKNSLNSFMKAKSKTWNGKGIFYNNNKSSRILFIYESGTRLRYEFCPLGWFTAERPKAPDVIQIDMTCYDFMQKFDQDMPNAAGLGLTYPCTIKTLFEKMCKKVGVEYVSSTFINSGATISAEPEDFSSVTMRDVLKWIAEASGSNARFNRDGKLEMGWLRDTSQSYEATNYSEFNPYWYETKKVTKLYNRHSTTGEDKTVGSGNEGYLIQDNPLLKGVG